MISFHYGHDNEHPCPDTGILFGGGGGGGGSGGGGGGGPGPTDRKKS